MNKIPLISFLALSIFGMLSCESNLVSNSQLDNSNGNSEIDLRDRGRDYPCSPGVIQTANNVIQFVDADAYSQTLEFFACSSPAQQDMWRNSHSIETSKKAYLAFRQDATYDNVNSESELFSIENQYDGKITVNIDEIAAERSYDVEYPILSDIVDVDGIFMIGEDMIRIVEDHMITVKNGVRDEVLKLDKDVEVTENVPPLDGDVINNTIITVRGGPGCCPDEKFIQKTFTSNGLRRISAQYTLFASSSTETDATSTTASLSLTMSTRAEKRKKFIIWSWWALEEASSLTLETAHLGTYTFGLGADVIEGDIVWPPEDFDSPDIDTESNVAEINNVFHIVQYNTEEEGLPKGSFFEACLDEAHLVGKNDEFGVQVEFECGEEIEVPPPTIIFYLENDGEGEVVCELVLDPAVGYLNFKDYAPCANDDARSAILHNMRKGMRFRVFDNPDMETDDDFAIVDIKEDSELITINTFEKSENEVEYKLTYVEKNGLDGKISSFIDN